MRKSEKAELVGVAGGRRAKGFAEKYGIKCMSIEELAESPSIDAVIITTPHGLHREHALKALEGGKHVLVEKPMALTVKDCEEMIEAAKSRGLKLMVGHSRRYFPVDRVAKEVLERGEIGEIIMVRLSMGMAAPDFNFMDKDTWYRDPELSKGLFIGFGVHIVDRLNWWVGSRLRSIFARFGAYWGSEEVENGGMVFVEYENGTYATIWTLYSGPDRIRRPYFPGLTDTAEIVGEKGLLLVKSYQGVSIRKGEEWETLLQPPKEEIEKGVFESQLDDFLTSILEDREPPITGEDGKRAVELCEAAYTSWKEDRLVRIED